MLQGQKITHLAKKKNEQKKEKEQPKDSERCNESKSHHLYKCLKLLQTSDSKNFSHSNMH